MRTIAFIALIIVSTLVPWYMLLLLALGYALYFRGAVELLVLAALIDGYFGVHTLTPYYTLSALVLLFLAEWLKPRLIIYNEA